MSTVDGSQQVQEFYVYLMRRPDGRPCYVGKGKGNRAFCMNRTHNTHLARIIMAAGGKLNVEFLEKGLSEAQALIKEKEWIAHYGRDKQGGMLVNLTDGGEGQCGWVPTQETREKIRKSNTGKKLSQQTRERMSKAGKGRKKSPEHRHKIGEAHKGMKFTPEQSARINAIRATPEFREKKRLAALAQHASMTDEERAARRERISQRTKEAMRTKEMKEKMSSLAKKAYLCRDRLQDGRFA